MSQSAIQNLYINCLCNCYIFSHRDVHIHIYADVGDVRSFSSHSLTLLMCRDQSLATLAATVADDSSHFAARGAVLNTGPEATHE